MPVMCGKKLKQTNCGGGWGEETTTKYLLLVCGVLAPGKLLTIPSVAVTDSLPKHLLLS